MNGLKIDFDWKLDFTGLNSVCDLTVYDLCESEETFISRLTDCNVIIGKEIPITGSMISKFPPSVQLIVEGGTGFNNINIAAASAAGISVCNVPAYATDSQAEMVIANILNWSCSMINQSIMLNNGNRQNFLDVSKGGGMRLPHFEIQGKRLGLVGGSGASGTRTAQMGAALGMEVVISSRSDKPTATQRVVNFDELMRTSDFISLHCPLTPDTHHLIDSTALRKCKPSAFLINTARGPIVNEMHLITALQNGTIAGAGLDVQVLLLIASSHMILSPQADAEKLSAPSSALLLVDCQVSLTD